MKVACPRRRCRRAIRVVPVTDVEETPRSYPELGRCGKEAVGLWLEGAQRPTVNDARPAIKVQGSKFIQGGEVAHHGAGQAAHVDSLDQGCHLWADPTEPEDRWPPDVELVVEHLPDPIGRSANAKSDTAGQLELGVEDPLVPKLVYGPAVRQQDPGVDEEAGPGS